MAEERNYFIDGAAYERRMGRWSCLAGEQFLDWLALPKGLRWLDVGCGTGAFTELIIARCAPVEVQGLDPSESQIAYARTRPGARLAQFRQGDAQALPYADGGFDAAAMALVISFLPDPARAIAEMARVVRPGGWLGSYMWDLPGGGLPLEPILVAMKSMDIAPPNMPGFAVSRLDRMRALWEEARLDSIETRVIRIPIIFPDFDEFWESNTGTGGPIGQAIQELPRSAREQLKAGLHQRLPRDPEGHIRYTAHANAVRGRVPG